MQFNGKHLGASMKKLIALIAFIAATFSTVDAQQVTPPGDTALVCAYNSSAPTPIQSGKFGYVQCDSQGRLLPSNIAAASLTFSVTTTGNDSNPCTIALPCLTLQRAANVANGYNWNNQYFPTINVAGGAYSGVQVALPALFNCPNGGVIAFATSVTVNDAGTNWTFTTAAFSQWTFSGTLILGGSYGGINTATDSILNIPGLHLTFSGTLTHGGITSAGDIFGTLADGTNPAVINTTTASMGTLFFYRGYLILNGASITFTNAIAFPSNNFVVAGDSSTGFFGFIGGTFVTPGNVTAAVPLVLSSNAFFEADGTSLSGGSPLTRANFPGVSTGGVVTIDTTSKFQPDWSTGFPAISPSVFFTALGVQNTSAGGRAVSLYEVGSSGFLGQGAGTGAIFDFTGGLYIMSWDTAANAQFTGAVQWSAQGVFTFNAADTSLSRTGAAALALGNGTAGDFSGTLKLAHVTATALANSATTSALCYNTGTGVFTYNSTIGTCTVSDERLKNMGKRIPGALDKLLRISGVYGTWKDPAMGTDRQIFIGAQTAERVFPELVQTDADGKKSLDYQRLTAPIIEALRELKADNDNLKMELRKLKSTKWK